MKKFVLAAGAFFLFVASFAQTTNNGAGAIFIKPAIGFNVTDFSKAPPGGESKGKVGFQIGGSLLLGNKVYFEPGIFYSRKSSQYSTQNTPADKVKLNIGGLYVPLAVGVNLLGDETTFANVHVLGGFSGFFITDVSNGNKSDYKSPTYGTFAGLGADISIFFVDLKYEWSLTNVQKDISDIDVGKSRTFFINAGLKLKL